MSSSNNFNKGKKNENLEQAQNNQNDVGAAESNPETTGPAENTREEAFEATDESEAEEDAT